MKKERQRRDWVIRVTPNAVPNGKPFWKREDDGKTVCRYTEAEADTLVGFMNSRHSELYTYEKVSFAVYLSEG